MTRVIVNADTRAKLNDLKQPVQLCDENGNVLGLFTPSQDQNGGGRREPQISEEEIQRREQSDERRYTTAEVLAHLENL
jgi:hypothetical protein